MKNDLIEQIIIDGNMKNQSNEDIMLRLIQEGGLEFSKAVDKFNSFKKGTSTDNEIREFCDAIAKNHLMLVQNMEAEYKVFMAKAQKQIAETDALKSDRADRMKLIRRLSLMGLACESANSFYKAINKACCN